MRTSKLSSKEILQADKAADDRVRHRNSGFSLMKDRDQGSVRLSNGSLLEWNAPDQEVYLGEGVTVGEGEHKTPIEYLTIPCMIPDGMVRLDGKMYNSEELLKWLRWA